jgi:UDP-N-acetylmuramoyl-L-alanyl-D-glutamate--2,6-diaminopimelate ligase
MTLSQLFSKAAVSPLSLQGDADLSSMVVDSRKVTPGACFVCMPGTTNDSHQFLADAAAKGARAAIVHS